jgi:hypothetical protein
MGIQGDWGQGAANNDIYWGQAAATNSISWGMVQPLSYGHPTTNLYGSQRARCLEQLVRGVANNRNNLE